LWFVYSMNEMPADNALADRIFYVRIDGYSQEDKFCIVKNYLLKKAVKNIGWEEGSIRMSDEAVKYLVEKISPDNLEVKNRLPNMAHDVSQGGYPRKSPRASGEAVVEVPLGIRGLEHAITVIINKINFLYHHQNRQGKMVSFRTTFDLGKKLVFPYCIEKENVEIFLRE